jgi:hypothetical protein
MNMEKKAIGVNLKLIFQETNQNFSICFSDFLIKSQ